MSVRTPMAELHTTSWRLIRRAAEGDPADRETFADKHGFAVRAFFAARWRRSPLAREVEDAVQEVFVECFREDGVLQRADPGCSGGFRAFFYGALRNVAARYEKRYGAELRRREDGFVSLDGLPHGDDSASRVVDHKWAVSVVKEAADRHAELAAAGDDRARRRHELLRLRFQDGLPIREIARLWGEDPAHLHHEYARARAEFEASLREVLATRTSREDLDEVLLQVLEALAKA